MRGQVSPPRHPADGPHRVGQECGGARTRATSAAGDRQRRFGAGVSRHGHRHGQARPQRRARRCRIIWSTSSIPTRHIRPRVFASTRSRRSRPFAPAAALRCSSAARCCTSRRCAKDCRHCRVPIPASGRDSTRGPPPKAGRRCTPSLRASIRSPRRGSSPPTASASSGRWRSTRSRDGRCRRCTAPRSAGEIAGALAFALVPIGSRAICIEALRERFEAMLAAGLVDELRALARALCAAPGTAVDALRRLSPGVGVPRRRGRPAPRCASAASPRPGNSPSGSSPGCDRSRRLHSTLSTTGVDADRQRDRSRVTGRLDVRMLPCNNHRFTPRTALTEP